MDFEELIGFTIVKVEREHESVGGRTTLITLEQPIPLGGSVVVVLEYGESMDGEYIEVKEKP